MKKPTTITGSVRRCATAALTALTAALTALLLVACAEDDMVSGGQNDVINLKTTVSEVSVTRAAANPVYPYNTSFNSGVNIDLLISDGSSTRAYYLTTTSENGAVWYSDAGRSTEVVARWIGAGDHDFYACYPAGFINMSDINEPAAFTVSAAQGANAAPTLSDGTSADILFSSNTVSRGTNPVNLEFRHKMTKVTVALTAGAGITAAQLESATVTLHGVKRSGTLNTTTGAVTATGGKSSITMKNAGNTGLTQICLLPPQSLTGATISIAFDGGGTVTYDIPDGTDGTAGTNTQFTLTTTLTAITAATTMVVPWRTAADADEITDNNLYSPVTLSITTTGSVTLAKVGSPSVDKQYQYRKYTAATKQWSDWTAFAVASSVAVVSGDKVQLIGNNVANGTDDDNYYHFTVPTGTSVSGNIMSLLGGFVTRSTGNFADLTTVATANAFRGVFRGATGLTDASRLLLPATTLAQDCYRYMFYGCTGLTDASRLLLPATTLAQGCYYYMFATCTSLTQAPALPATTLAQECYRGMFASCTNLTAAPVLPATTLAEGCYRGMFYGCTSLNEVHCAATDISATDCTTGWLASVSPTGHFYGKSDAGWTSGTSGIPTGWTTEAYNIYYSNPLTLEAGSDGTVTFAKEGTPPSTTLKYRKYTAATGQWDATWSTVPVGSVTVKAGDKVQIVGNGPTATADLSSYYYVSACPVGSRVSGNIMSVLYGLDGGNYTTAFANKKTLTGSAAFYRLFYGNTGLTYAHNLMLPAMTLTNRCYREMFQNCTTLKTAPVLPATTLAPSCYYRMFRYCTSLTAVPALPALTLAQECYFAMFQGCTSLTAVPALPATTLAEGCYRDMFNLCTSLTTVPDDMLPATTLVESCYRDMFSGCSSLTTAPALPATTLAPNCYRGMFYNCSALTEVRCNATDISATDCTTSWLYGVPAGGTFYLMPGVGWSIPSGWTCEVYGNPMTLEAGSNGTVTLAKTGAPSTSTTLKYTKYTASTRQWQTGWSTVSSGSLPLSVAVQAGDKVIVAGNGPTGFDREIYYNLSACPAGSMVSGNIMSVLGGLDSSGDYTTAFANKKTLTGDFAFCGLFNGNTGLTYAHNLMLPATTLTAQCYRGMFQGCTSLTTAPALPATTLTYFCYLNMFYGCTSLTAVPVLPATTMTGGCYFAMFKNCSSLTTVPDDLLPATTAASQCYYGMFEGCTSLTKAPVLPAQTMASECYRGMFYGCISLTTAPALPATTLAPDCYRGMFLNCNNLVTPPTTLPATSLAERCYYGMFLHCNKLTTAPRLPATTLVEGCYQIMFQECPRLQEVRCNATSGINTNNSTTDWLDGVNATGTFYRNTGATWPTNSANGIPSGWTTQNY